MMGPGRASRKQAWKKVAVGVVVLLGLVWVFGPRQGADFTTDLPTPGLEDTYIPPQGIIPTSPNSNDTPEPPNQSSNSSIRPTSPETDPDLLKTVFCTSPHNPSSPLVQYALMIDAGSTGSRIHVYKFHNCGPSPAYEYEVFKMTQPGLSAYKGHPTDAAQSLDVLLDEAMRVVPASLRSCTPIAVKATAGLRLLGTEDSTDILNSVRSHLLEKYPFALPQTADRGVAIMDGKDEGVYAWITANYLLDTIRADSKPGTSYAVLDLGGGSTQIVFEPVFEEGTPGEVLKEGDHKYDLEFGGVKRVLYQHSYLGYGLKSARESVHRVVDFMATLRTERKAAELSTRGVPNPCIAQGTEKVMEITEPGSDLKRSVKMVGEDVGSFDACNRVLELVLAKDAVCELKPCSFDGVYQPSLMNTFPSGKILLLSYFYDRINPFLSHPSGSSPEQPQLTIASISSLAIDVCRGQPTWEQRWGGNADLMSELEGRPEWCLDLTFMHALLVLGYEFADIREVTLGKQIDGTELGWCLGATIAMVGADLKCRA
ncbi:nucleoside phosphatase family-domain-containing protein [Hygrophoropsis aurantiaca]|uniref:Nucleoside phosphatase family-domain-containing protein n=1 Tax=Hygrophoropsis aurantiaca TaxID=72124 RepID=A0ACB8ALW7_9AGAM|nr:nucleoside phosphatase family-domain-containing protein [Hygrophoropsis aurantiaca]